MKNYLKKALAVLMAAAMLMCVCLPSYAVGGSTESKLRFNDDGTFKIMHITDIQDDCVLAGIVKHFMKDMIPEEKPDLIVLGGDNIRGGRCGSRIVGLAAIDQFMSIFEEMEIPVLVCFGNHDEEGFLSKQEMFEKYSEYSCFIGYDDGDIFGYVNNSVPVYSSTGDSVALNVYAIDSNDYNENEDIGGYGYVHQDQLDWYRSERDALYAEQGHYVPSVAFQHIIVPQIYTKCMTEVAAESETTISRDGRFFERTAAITGEINESPCPPCIDEAKGYLEYEAMAECGDVMAMFFGHDHVNDFVADAGEIDLVNTPGMGFSSYGGANRGVRVITFNENDPYNYETHTVTYLNYYADDPAMLSMIKASGSEYSFFERVAAAFEYLFYTVVGWFDFGNC